MTPPARLRASEGPRRRVGPMDDSGEGRAVYRDGDQVRAIRGRVTFHPNFVGVARRNGEIVYLGVGSIIKVELPPGEEAMGMEQLDRRDIDIFACD